MLELIALEHRCAELRASLGLSHRLTATSVSEAAEQAIHELVALHASDFLSVHAGDGTYLWASASSERLFGWKPSELIGRSAYDLFHPEDLARIADNHREHVDADAANAIEYRLRTADRGYRWVSTHSTNCKDERGLPQIVAFTRDISEQRERRDRLERLLTELQSAVGASDELISLCAWCRQVVRSASGEWQQLEAYLTAMTGRMISHGICQGCVSELGSEI